VNDREIFFGPCKKGLRKRMRDQILLPHKKECVGIKEDIYIVGINAKNTGSNKGGADDDRRKIIWAGKVQKVMTFANAHRLFQNRKHEKGVEKMLDNDFSPIHLTPILLEGELRGYEHHGKEHAENNAWIMDVVQHKVPKHASMEGDKLMLTGTTSGWTGFPRDACMLLDNLFFADGDGISLDDAALEILRDAQSDKVKDRVDIQEESPFGRTKNNSVNGLRGTQLELKERDAERFIRWLEPRTQAIAKKRDASYEKDTSNKGRTTGRC